MKLVVDTKQLLSALHRLSAVVPKGAAAKVGVLGCVKLNTHGLDHLSLAGTDGHAVGHIALDCDTDGLGEPILPEFARLLAAVESCPGADVELSTTKPEKLEIRSGAFRASLGLSEPDLFPTLPEMPPAAPVHAPALFPALSRAISMGSEKEGGREGALWQIEADLVSVVAATPHLGSLEEFVLTDATTTEWPDVDPERLLPRDWAILKSWSGIGALNGAFEIQHGADERFTFWAGPDWQLWFLRVEGQMGSLAAYRKGFSGGAGTEISPEAMAAIRQGFEAVSGATVNGRDAVTILTGGPDGFSVKTRSDNSAAWTDETPIPEINWSAGSAENLLKTLAVLGEKEGPIMMSMSPKGDSLRLERGGLVCLVAGYR